jgi:hypothetical protein
LVRVKTRARSMSSSTQKRVDQQRGLFRLVDLDDAYCSTARPWSPGATETSAGLVRYLSASSLIAGGMVAEKNRVWRFFGSSDDPLERVDEAEVEHLVGLVENEDLELGR